MTRPLILCADDFGYRPGVDEGILTLARLGRLSAVSCLVTGETVGKNAERLLALAGKLDIGLHMALTEMPRASGAGPAVGPSSVNALIAAAYGGRLDRKTVEEEVRAQVGLFHRIFNRAPDFIDGHQHVHVLPVVRDAVLALFADGTLDVGQTSMRDCYETPQAIVERGEAVPKALVIAALARATRRRARRQGIRTNDSFRGIYGFDNHKPYRARFARFAAGAGERPLIMCHPGLDEASASQDPIAPARQREFDYFTGPDFEADLVKAGVALKRFRDPSGARI